jgi:hypothetical protein
VVVVTVTVVGGGGDSAGTEFGATGAALVGTFASPAFVVLGIEVPQPSVICCALA